MLNEKFRENVPAWDTIRSTDKFPAFFRRLMRLQSEHEMGTRESISYLVFLIHCFQSLEEPAVRQSVLQLVSLRLWRNLSPARREQQLREFPQVRAASCIGRWRVVPAHSPVGQLERHWQYMQARMELEDACYVERKRIEHAQTAGAATQAAANKARKLVQETEGARAPGITAPPTSPAARILHPSLTAHCLRRVARTAQRCRPQRDGACGRHPREAGGGEGRGGGSAGRQDEPRARTFPRSTTHMCRLV